MNNVENEISNCLNNSASKIHASLDLKDRAFSKLKDRKKNEHQLLATKEHKNSYKRLIIDIAEVTVFVFILFAIPTYVNYHKNSINKNHSASTAQGENITNKNDDSDIKSSESSNRVQSYEIKGNNYAGYKLITSDPTKIILAFSGNNSQNFKTTSEIAKENNALCAINAGFFKAALPGDDINSPNTPLGVTIHESSVLYSDLSNDVKTSIVGFNNKGLLIVGNYSINEMKQMQIKEAVSNSITLILNGKAAEVTDGIGPKTAIGQKHDGSVIFLVIDGRNQTSAGASIKDVQKELLDAGAVNAALLDGGSSTTMVLNGKVINHPCNNNTERKIPSAFVVLP